MIRTILLSALLIATAAAVRCRGRAMYKVSFRNLMTPRRFKDLIPESGLVFSPLAGVSHSNRISFLTVRGFASKTVEEIAETGNNLPFLKRAMRIRRRGEGVKTVVGAAGPTLPGRKTTLVLKVDCDHPFITVIGMVAPSPDWIVQINNVNMFNMTERMFVDKMSGKLIAYDAGTDDGREFTDPSDPSLDEPTVPPKNIAPLVEDETDRFEGRFVGRFFIEKVDKMEMEKMEMDKMEKKH